jgi:hypothetical protein
MPDSIRTTTTTIQKLKEKEGEIIPEMIGNDDPLKSFCKAEFNDICPPFSEYKILYIEYCLCLYVVAPSFHVIQLLPISL